MGAPIALIGEAPSAHGARFSGIAFTAERSLAPADRTSAPGLRRDGFSEHSASVLASALRRAGFDLSSVMLWNAVPFHPADPSDPLRNRRPTASELVLGIAWLERILALMRPGMVVAVGRTAGRALPPGTRVIRHPANGGSRQLTADLTGLARELRIPPVPPVAERTRLGCNRYHYVELTMPAKLRAVIAARAQAVWDELSRPGAGGPLLCLTAVAAWKRELLAAGIAVIQQGRGLDNRSWTEAGGYLVQGEEQARDHHWLAIGDGLWLFDPTAGQFADATDRGLEPYLAADGQAFLSWRAIVLGDGRKR
jgi:hypothetical protein